MHPWLWSDRMLHTFGLPIPPPLPPPRGPFPWRSLAQHGASDCIVGHEKTGCSWCNTLVSSVLWSGSLFVVFSAVQLLSSAAPRLGTFSSLTPSSSAFLRNTQSLCWVNQACNRSELGRFHELWIISEKKGKYVVGVEAWKAKQARRTSLLTGGGLIAKLQRARLVAMGAH